MFDAATSNVGRHGLKRGEIAMDVRNDGNSHDSLSDDHRSPAGVAGLDRCPTAFSAIRDFTNLRTCAG